ncbi:MAG: glycosyltransferase [Nitrospirae bacterium]|nr:glycosyltransferase [Nitrospirota bacterium]
MPVKVMLLAIGLGVGGTEGYIKELASRLDRRRFQVVVCVLKGDDCIARELRDSGARVITLGGMGKSDVRVLVRFLHVVRAEMPDVIHAFLFWANLVSRVVGKLLRVPVLISAYHDLELNRAWHHLLADRLTVQWAHAITCCSAVVGRTVGSQVGGGSEKCVTIPFGVDVGRFSNRSSLGKQDLGLDESLPVVGTVCRLVEPKKGLTALLHAVAQLQEGKAVKCQLLVVGEGPAHRQLRDLAVRLGIARLVVFAGVRRDIEKILPLMDVFVLPSLYEGLGIAILEAMAASRPVIATDVGGIPEIVVHGTTGLLVPPGDPSALAAAIQELFEHPDRAASFGLQGRRRAEEEFAISRMVEKHQTLYEALVAQRRAEGVTLSSLARS